MALGDPHSDRPSDRRSARHEATKAEILETAWHLVREEGLAGLSLRDLAHRVGMRAPSLYSYFDSKHAIYDAMFAQGYQQLLARQAEPTGDPRADLVRTAQVFLEFCVEDSARYHLLFQRTIPGFEPTPESYAMAVEALVHAHGVLAEVGITDPSDRDLWTALLTGLTDQQISNDPGGDRWSRLVEPAVDMFLNHVATRPRRATNRKGK